MKIVIIIFAVLLLACSPQKRMNKLIDKHPEFVQNDTLVFNDTIYIESVKADTVLWIDSMIDTVLIEKDNLKIRTVFRDNQIYIEGECESDTIYYTKEVPVEKVVYLEDPPWAYANRFIKRWLKWIVLLFMALGVAKIVKGFFG